MACVVMQEGETMTRDELNEFLAPQMAKVRCHATLAFLVVHYGAVVVLRRLTHALRHATLRLLLQWWLPDHMEIIDEIPKTAVGKFSKKDLRARFDDVEVA